MFKDQLTNDTLTIVIEFTNNFTKSSFKKAKQRPLNLPFRNVVVTSGRVGFCGIEEGLPKAKGLE
jgi:hypothetical protein